MANDAIRSWRMAAAGRCKYGVRQSSFYLLLNTSTLGTDYSFFLVGGGGRGKDEGEGELSLGNFLGHD